MRQQPAHRMADGRLLRCRPGRIRHRNIQRPRVKRNDRALPILPQKQRSVDGIIGSKSVKSEHGRMEQVPSMYGRAGEIAANGFQQHLVPLPGNGLFHSRRPGLRRSPIHRRKWLLCAHICGQQQPRQTAKHSTTHLHRHIIYGAQDASNLHASKRCNSNLPVSKMKLSLLRQVHPAPSEPHFPYFGGAHRSMKSSGLRA